ncbi:matrixin family metalloprotease [Limosilactobacillus pontis]|uniref:Matrixin family metalloprotease n=1 Tax=Limosilactobacillus pontis TaxID=35787 RepID=A0ABU7SRJ6_9LACO
MKRLLILLCMLPFFWGWGMPAHAMTISSINQSSVFSSGNDQENGMDSRANRAAAKALHLPSSTPTPTEGYRWPTRQLKIYMATHDRFLQSAFFGAVRAWNRTGAVHISWCHDEDRADIIAQDGSLTSTGTSSNVGYVSSQLGSTSTEYNPDTHALIRARSTLDPSQLDYTSRHFRTAVAEHELGHALGLAHAPEYMHSVMIPRNVRTGITRDDRATICLLYGLKR